MYVVSSSCLWVGVSLTTSSDGETQKETLHVVRTNGQRFKDNNNTNIYSKHLAKKCTPSND